MRLGNIRRALEGLYRCAESPNPEHHLACRPHQETHTFSECLKTAAGLILFICL